MTEELAVLQSKWISLHDALNDSVKDQELAAPFVSAGSEKSDQGRAILLVGKATWGAFYKEQFDIAKNKSIRERVQERRETTELCIQEKKNSNTAFWAFRRKLVCIGRPVVWTNLAKIGAASGNPRSLLLGEQQDLAQRTLRAEMEEYKPALVVLVTSTYAAKEIAHPVFGHDESWEKPMVQCG